MSFTYITKNVLVLRTVVFVVSFDEKGNTFVINRNDVDREKGDAKDREGVQGYDFERFLVHHQFVYFS